MNRRARSMFGLCLAGLALLSGCIPEIIDSGKIPADAALEPGSYWVLETEAGVDLYRMPAFRGDEGQWQSVAGVPEWFTQEGLYSHDAGMWNLEMAGDQADLDALLQVWDPVVDGE